MNVAPKQNTILVIDDSPETLAMINDVLEKAGLTCLVSIDPLQGLNIAKKMQPDLILVDGLMPNMTGFELCKTCKTLSETRDIPVMFMTGLSDSDSIVQAFEAGGVDYVTKPIDCAALIARIRVHLANASIIRSTQLALDKAGQHIFAVDSSGELLWQTPDVIQSLENIAINGETDEQNQWLDTEFWPSVKHWIKNNNGATLTSLHLHYGGTTVTLEALNTSPASGMATSEILIRLCSGNQQNDCDLLRDHFNLSTRESDVLFWIAKGKTNREIGYILGISPRTINKHLEQVFKKLEVDNRTNAAAKAIPILRP